MAPKKRSANAKQEQEEETAKPVVASSRVTRSSTRQAANAKSGNSVHEFPQPELPKKKKVKGSQKEIEEVKPEKTVDEVLENDGDETKRKTIVIEHCKQCNSFKTRAIKVKEGLENGVSGIIVILNPDKPRRGCFEIREDGGEKFISLLEMKRPFELMKKLDMDKVISDIIDKIK